MQRALTLENSSFNVVLLKYLWHMTAVKIEIEVSRTSHKNEDSILEYPEQVTTNKPTHQPKTA